MYFAVYCVKNTEPMSTLTSSLTLKREIWRFGLTVKLYVMKKSKIRLRKLELPMPVKLNPTLKLVKRFQNSCISKISAAEIFLRLGKTLFHVYLTLKKT